MPTRLLVTKLHVPAPGSQLVSRPALLDRLGALRALTLVSAPAGFGKTTLLAEWIAHHRRSEPDVRVAWLSLDDGDNDPSRFLAYVVAALQALDAGVGRGLNLLDDVPALPAGHLGAGTPAHRHRARRGGKAHARPRPDLPLADIAAALRHLEDGHARGKVAITVI
jgi:hypothetical protein